MQPPTKTSFEPASREANTIASNFFVCKASMQHPSGAHYGPCKNRSHTSCCTTHMLSRSRAAAQYFQFVFRKFAVVFFHSHTRPWGLFRVWIMETLDTDPVRKMNPPKHTSHRKQVWPPRPAATWRSRQLYATFVRPPSKKTVSMRPRRRSKFQRAWSLLHCSPVHPFNRPASFICGEDACRSKPRPFQHHKCILCLRRRRGPY